MGRDVRSEARAAVGMVVDGRWIWRMDGLVRYGDGMGRRNGGIGAGEGRAGKGSSQWVKLREDSVIDGILGGE